MHVARCGTHVAYRATSPRYSTTSVEPAFVKDPSTLNGVGPKQEWIVAAYRDEVPARAVAHKCRNWGISRARAEQLAAEASGEAHFRSLGQSFQNERHYRGWVTLTAINFTIDGLRAGARSRSLNWVASADKGTQEADCINQWLEEGLATLDDLERSLVRMTFEDGLTLNEICRIFEKTQGEPTNAGRLRIKRRRDRALKKLRDFLIRHGFPGNL